MGEIKSSTTAANDAVKGIENVTAPSGATVYLGKSNLTSMTNGEEVANQMMSHLSQLIECIDDQCLIFKQIAESIEERDRQTKFVGPVQETK